MFRMIGTMYDKRGSLKDALIFDASQHHGFFSLWVWDVNKWRKIETFVF